MTRRAAGDVAADGSALLVKALARKLAALEEGPARAGAAARALADLPAEDAVPPQNPKTPFNEKLIIN